LTLLELLLEAGVDSSFCEESRGFISPSFAIYTKRLSFASRLLKGGAKVDYIEKAGQAAVHIAPLRDDITSLKVLVQYGASINILSLQTEKNPLYIATGHGNIEAVKVLLGLGANPDLAGQDLGPLYLAFSPGEADIAECLLKSGASIESRTKAGFTPLWGGIYVGRVEMFRYLLENGANLQFQTNAGFGGALHFSCIKGRKIIVIFLI
jgi:ankyrin repeat protein